MTLPFETFSPISESLNQLRSNEMRKKIWVDKLFGVIGSRVVFSALRLIDHDGKDELSDINVFLRP
jgi:hypothetical protein